MRGDPLLEKEDFCQEQNRTRVAQGKMQQSPMSARRGGCLVCCRIHSDLLFYPSLDKFLSVLVLSGFVMVIQLPRLMLVFYKLVYVQWENSMALM